MQDSYTVLLLKDVDGTITGAEISEHLKNMKIFKETEIGWIKNELLKGCLSSEGTYYELSFGISCRKILFWAEM